MYVFKLKNIEIEGVKPNNWSIQNCPVYCDENMPVLDACLTALYKLFHYLTVYIPSNCLFYVFSRVSDLLMGQYYYVCSIVKTITPRCRGRPDALLHEAEGIRSSTVPRGSSWTILQKGME